MSVLFWGFSGFLLSLLIHLAIWRLRLPRRRGFVLAQILLLGLIVNLALLWGALQYGFALAFQPVSWIEFVYIGFLNLSLSLSYLISYSGFETASPTALILFGLEDAGSNGLTRRDFSSIVTDDELITKKMLGLEMEGIVQKSKGRYIMTGKGGVFLKLFLTYKTLMARRQRAA